MPGKVFTAEQVVNKLCRIEVLQGERRSGQQPCKEAGTTDVELKKSEPKYLQTASSESDQHNALIRKYEAAG
jgi:hypothetical protein